MKTKKEIKERVKSLKRFCKKHKDYKTGKDILALGFGEARLQMLEWVLK